MKKSILSSLIFFTSVFYAAGDPLFFTPDMIKTHLKGYSEVECRDIKRDLDVVRSVCLHEGLKSKAKPHYIATAGGPGSRKSTILENFYGKDLDNVAYIDPDQRSLKFMVNTYYAQSLSARSIAKFRKYITATRAAYEKWRGASNYITLSLLEEAFARNLNIAYGTTCTGGYIGPFLDNVKARGYDISLLLCYCSDAFRKNAIEYRNNEQKLYQSDPEVSTHQTFLFPQRMPIYFAKADELLLFWSDDLTENALLAAIVKEGHMTVVHAEALQKFIEKYEADREKLYESKIELPEMSELLKSNKKLG